MKVLKTLTLAGMPFPTRIDDGQFIPTTPTTSSNLNPPAMMSKSKFTLDSLINPIKRVVTVSPQNENFTEDGILRLSDGEKKSGSEGELSVGSYFGEEEGESEIDVPADSTSRPPPPQENNSSIPPVAPMQVNPEHNPLLDIYRKDKEPWAADTTLIVPIQATQVLIYESAAILAVKTFLKIAKLPYTVMELSNATDISPNGKLPVLKCGALLVSELEGIALLAQAKRAPLPSENQKLNHIQKADLRAYMSLVQNVLGNSLLYFTWMTHDIYRNYTRRRVGSPYNFPLNVFVPWITRRRLANHLSTLGWDMKTSDEVYQEVETCLMALEERLGCQKYFFGNSPTEFDALAFGYLYTMMTASLPNTQLGNMIKHQGNLARFCLLMKEEVFRY